MRTNTRFVFVSHGNATHGAELCLVETVRALRVHGIEDIYVVLQKGGSYLDSLLIESGARIKHIPTHPRWVGQPLTFKKKLKWIRTAVSLFLNFRQILTELKPDFVVSNTVVCNPVFAIASKLKRIKHVWYIHELGDKDHGYKYYFGKRLSWFIINLFSDKIIVNSKFTFEYFTNKKYVDNAKIRVIYYAVAISRFREIDPDFDKGIAEKWTEPGCWKILIAGRTVAGKGQEDIINALGILKTVHNVDNFHLTIIGQVAGEYNTKLLNLVDRHGLQKNITMIPFIDNPGPYFREAHIGVTTSRNEAFGRVTVEYMKCNMVVAAANAGATNEIIENEVNGYLYELGDIKSFADILFKAISNMDCSRELAFNARNEIEERFNLDRHGMEVIGFLQGL
jgi:glycosyltransferase involved in cell wall biosynthesis